MTTTDSFEIWTLLPAGRDALYDAWLDAGRHAAFTRSPASSSPWIGGELSALDGHIRARFLELEPGSRIVLAWRHADFPPDAPDSIAEVRFEPEGDWTRMRIIHREVPPGLGDACEALWRERYFRPLAEFVQTLPEQAVVEAVTIAPTLTVAPETAPVAAPKPMRAPAKRAATARRTTKKAKAAAKPARTARRAAKPAKKTTAKKATARKATKKATTRRAPRSTTSARTTRAKATKKVAKKTTAKKATRRTSRGR